MSWFVSRSYLHCSLSAAPYSLRRYSSRASSLSITRDPSRSHHSIAPEDQNYA